MLSGEQLPSGVPAADAANDDPDVRAVLDTMPQIVWRTTPDGRVDFVNTAWYDFTGRTAAESLGAPWSAQVHPDDAARADAEWTKAVRAESTYDLDVRIRRADGAYRWFRTRAQPLRSHTGTVVRWFGSATDIDDIRNAAARDAFLARADAVAGDELETEPILRAVARAAVASFADYALFDLVAPDGVLRRVAIDHRDAAARAPFEASVGEAVPLDHPIHPIAAAWRGGESVLVPRIDASWWDRAAASEAHRARMRDAQLSSLISVVIPGRGGRLGLLTFCRVGSATGFNDADLATAEDLARRIGAALENARLYAEARSAAETQRRIAERETFYAHLGEALSEALDLRQTLATAIRLLVPQFADWAAVNLLDPDERLFLAASHHRDPALHAKTSKLVEAHYLAHDASGGSPQVVRTNRPLLYEEVADGGTGFVTEPYRETIAALGLCSVAIVPLAFGGRARGTVALLYDRTSGRRYRKEDLPFFSEVARRLAPAIGNAEAYEHERRVARTFQAAALTTKLPGFLGTSFDAVYEAGRSEALVGGDWYDAFRAPDGRVVVSIGDVAGSGIDAAATMAAIRQSLRGAAAINPDPSMMLDAADRVLRSQTPDRFVTAWVGVIDPVWATLTCAGAGHPAPLARDAAGEIRALPAGGLPLGLRERGQDVTQHLGLEPRTTLLLYTDGLIEAGRDIIAGEAAVARALRGADPEAAPARAIQQTVLNGNGSNDDVALLVVAFRESLLALGGERGAMRWTFDANNVAEASAARCAIVTALARRGLDEADRTTAELVFAELIGNTKRYAAGPIDVALDLSGEHAVLHVVDSGEGFQHNARLPSDALSENGRGLFIVAAIAEEFAVTRRPAGGAHARAVLKGRLA